MPVQSDLSIQKRVHRPADEFAIINCYAIRLINIEREHPVSVFFDEI